MPNTTPPSVRSGTRHRRVVAVLVTAIVVVLAAIALVAVRTVATDPTASRSLGAVVSSMERGPVSSTGRAGGEVPSGASVFDDGLPAVTRLDPDLLRAVRQAARDAEGEDVHFLLNSGWRSPALQERLLDDAVTEYGSREEAARWVSTPQTSLHVRGEAVDIGDWDAAAWLQEHGAAYGLCQIYTNEAWHFELRSAAPSEGCPQMYVDPTSDPRMQR
ncbi:M15 family metallopeptidase [Curtobacterium sp. MCLR17_036]|uniref:M15 family metallopeptidase n=1 Tax=Curtobacterium sp. MCLR17_036 TaxID=2175620 RepID=UPI000DA99246|nr:M15 family metallopeptidase [Curtobacterium sp. MCLR17_036]WIE65676.1 M15 family metallopeptidase [Curtobacterium sp. MCLR17_036]